MQLLYEGEYVGSIIRNVILDGIFASISSYNEDTFNNSWHCHQNAHISFVLKGGCSEKKKSLYERLPGKITFYHADEPHQIVKMCNSIHVNLEMSDSYFNQFDLTSETFGKSLKKTPDAMLLMLQVYKELKTGDMFMNNSIQMLVLAFLNQSKNWRNEENMPEWVKTVHELINDRWADNLSLADLSAAANVHPVTISHYFPKFFSCTLGTYMRKLKIERALELIKTSNNSLTDIAYECGFSDQSHFIRTFKQMTGFLPTHYMKL